MCAMYALAIDATALMLNDLIISFLVVLLLALFLRSTGTPTLDFQSHQGTESLHTLLAKEGAAGLSAMLYGIRQGSMCRLAA